ncbi:MAG: CRISPR-associated endonuclease Cas3'', partial [Thermosynechococcaceae cyanobacterium]
MQPELKPDRLLAKSVEGKWKGSYSLVGHTADVVGTVTTLVDVLGDRILQQFNLDCSLKDLRETVRLTAYLHDWGKANDHFQGVVRQRMAGASPKRNAMQTPQLVRHEILSLLLAWEFKDWLKHADGDFQIALVAAGGHHLKLGGKCGKQLDEIDDSVIRPCGDNALYTYLFHPDFKRLLRFGIKKLGCPAQLNFCCKPEVKWPVKRIKDSLQDLLFEEFPKFNLDPVFTAVVKALLVCGDSIGSAAPSVRTSITAWITEEVNCTLDQEKTQAIIDARLAGHTLRPFQNNLADSSARVTLARAGCGTGKTLGAYAWAKFHADGRKLFFCYPTTGTSTEGFIDYVHGKADAALLHSRADVDLARWEAERTIDDIYATGE